MEKEAEKDKGKKKKEAVPVDANFDYEGTFKSLAEEANRLMDDTESWSVVKEVKTCVGMCKLMKRKCHEKGYPDYYVGAECVFEGVTVDKFLDLFVVNMVTNCPKWDPTIVETKKVQKFSDQDWVYQYIFDPGRVFFLINKRDMVYYEGWRKDEVTGVVTNVGSSLKIVEDSIPVPKDTVRSHLKLHFKRGTPVDGGKSCKYQTLQLIDMGGLLPNGMVFDGVLNGLFVEIEGFFQKCT